MWWLEVSLPFDLSVPPKRIDNVIGSANVFQPHLFTTYATFGTKIFVNVKFAFLNILGLKTQNGILEVFKKWRFGLEGQIWTLCCVLFSLSFYQICLIFFSEISGYRKGDQLKKPGLLELSWKVIACEMLKNLTSLWYKKQLHRFLFDCHQLLFIEGKTYWASKRFSYQHQVHLVLLQPNHCWQGPITWKQKNTKWYWKE